MPRLYELSDKYNAFCLLLENADSEESQLVEQLGNIKEQFDIKAENIGKLVLSLESDTTAIQAEGERLASRKKTIERHIDYMKTYLQQEMITTNTETIKGKVLTLSLRKNPPSVNIVNQESIPSEFRHIIPETWQPDKKLILDHFKSTGEIIPGVDIIRDKKTLTIK